MSWRLARSLITLRDEISTRWPGTTIWTIGDAAHRKRASDHNPNGAGVVTAVDVVGPVAKKVVDQIIKTRDPRLKYMIYQSRIMAGPAGPAPWKWRSYGGSNPHNTHVHVSVGRGPSGRSLNAGLYDDSKSWGLIQQEEDDMMVVRYNDRDERVVRVQEILREAGKTKNQTLLPKYGTDGHYGDETAGAVNYFARRAKLPEDGFKGMDVLVLDYCRGMLENARNAEYTAAATGLTRKRADELYVQRGTVIKLT
jgi:hypothetical protein